VSSFHGHAEHACAVDEVESVVSSCWSGARPAVVEAKGGRAMVYPQTGGKQPDDSMW